MAPAAAERGPAHWYSSLCARVDRDKSKLTIDIAPEAGLSPALLTRARFLADEHAKLSARLGDTFDAKVAKRAGELAPIADVLKEWDKVNEVRWIVRV